MKIKQIILTTSLIAGLVGCSTNQAPVQAPVAEPVVEVPVQAQAPVQQAKVNNAVFFGFDKYDVQENYFNVVNQNANYLSSNPAKVQIQGNTDDIGSVEYNLSLGQKRADAVKKALIASGASSDKIETTSNGKLKPVMNNDTEDNRAFNRRADIMYKQDAPNFVSSDEVNHLPMINQ